jgi:tRNA pseudouridine55 synthase
MLTRTRVDKFNIQNAISFEELENKKENIDEILIKMEDVFSELPKISLNTRKEELFLNGVMLTFELDDGVYNIYANNKYLGTGTVKNKLLKRDIIIN